MFDTLARSTTAATRHLRPVDQPGLPATEPEPLHPGDASDELIAILCRIDQLQAQAAAALTKMNDAAKWRQRGYTSATAFLKHRAAMAPGRAMALVARSNALSGMPLTSRGLQTG